MSELLPDFETDDPTGVVLAGGYSRRFGDRDKALARLGGRALLARVVGRLGEVADRVVVNCRADQRAAFADALAADDSAADDSAERFDATSVPVEFVADPVADRGPLYGFRAALGAVESETCLLAACDAPFLDPRLLADLAERVVRGERDAAAVLADQRPVPTQAAYRTAPTEEACDALLDADVARLAALFDRLDARAVPAAEVAGDAERSLFDVDTPADHGRAARLLRDGGDGSRVGGREVTRPR
ncbi:molybdenum cofactor guanylyltransferase [Halorussus salinus]|uniref:molybdenum cofactor guanylyltransferase n=1 Tax=Halorussus salinus TaxID=1364935 RepID=UPI00138EE4D8|nr:molybdenum cofactor guanylyltransferase [Halorussus salinus]